MNEEVKKSDMIALLEQIEERKRNYKLIDIELQPHQKELVKAISLMKGDDFIYKWLLFQGGNGAGKSFVALYIVVCLALGTLTKELGLEYIGRRKNIYVGTKSGANLKNTIMTYILNDYGPLKIPDEYISSKTLDNGIIKTMTLTNGTTINFFTYDQGYERIQGTNGDLYLLDEEPKKKDIFDEALARTRGKNSQLFLSMTPLSGYTPVYSYFYEQKSENVKKMSYTQIVNSLENKYADHTWAEGLTDNDKKMRMQGMFTPASGLVYPNFDRNKHTVSYFHPKELGSETKFYGAVDFGREHPLAFAFIAVDADGHIYVFDLIYKSHLFLSDLKKEVDEKKRKYGIEFEYIIADTAGKRERTELKKLGMKTTPAKKWEKGENDMSNRKTGIMKVNQLLSQGKIYINKDLAPAIKEFEVHLYKEGGKKDGETDKINDDFLDAFRYFIFGYKVPKYISSRESKYMMKHGASSQNKYLKKNRN